MEFEGHITAESEFNVIEIFKCHFRMHNIVVLSFRMDRMPNIDTNDLYTTMIPLSSMKKYEFECNLDQVNVMVGKNILIGNSTS